MPQDVIDRVHTLARRAAANVALTFADRYGEIIPDDDDDGDDDADYVPDDADGADNDDADDYSFDADDDDAPDDPGHIAGVEGHYPTNANLIADADDAAEGPHEVVNDDDIPANANDAHGDAYDDNDDVPQELAQPETTIDADELADEEGKEAEVDTHTDDAEVDTNISTTMDAQYGERTAAYNLRPRKPRDYGQIHTTLEHTVLTQMSMKKGIREFGDTGVDAVLSEL
jgi:hypothetical protein